jgi:hypothetical protein
LLTFARNTKVFAARIAVVTVLVNVAAFGNPHVGAGLARHRTTVDRAWIAVVTFKPIDAAVSDVDVLAIAPVARVGAHAVVQGAHNAVVTIVVAETTT